MGSITLPSRQSLSRRVPGFGSVNNRVFRFGDTVQDSATLQAEVNAMNQTAGRGSGPQQHTMLLNTLDWASLFQADPVRVREAYSRINMSSLDPEFAPTIEAWIEKHPGSVVPAVPVSNPITITVTTPGMTDAQYQAAVEKARIEAERLLSMAAAKQAENAAHSKQIAAEDALAKAKAEEANRNVDVTTPPAKKSSFVPLLLTVGLGYLLLKG